MMDFLRAFKILCQPNFKISNTLSNLPSKWTVGILSITS